MSFCSFVYYLNISYVPNYCTYAFLPYSHLLSRSISNPTPPNISYFLPFHFSVYETFLSCNYILILMSIHGCVCTYVSLRIFLEQHS